MLTRDAYVAKKKKQLDDWNAEMGVLEAAALKRKEASMPEPRARLAQLRARQQEAARKLRALVNDTKDEWGP